MKISYSWTPIRKPGELPEFPLTARRLKKLQDQQSPRLVRQNRSLEWLFYHMWQTYAPQLPWPPVVEEDAHGKPYLPQYPDIHLSMSHSGDYVACALAGGPVGIDIQQMLPGKEHVGLRFFTASEKEFIQSSPDALIAFYQIWTAKESCIKAAGLTLSTGLGLEVHVDVAPGQERATGWLEVDGRRYIWKSAQPEKDYMVSICHEVREGP